jgi:hypothetical protein
MYFLGAVRSTSNKMPGLEDDECNSAKSLLKKEKPG